MSKHLILFVCLLTISFTACEKNETTDLREKEQAHLDGLLDEIKEIAASVPCVDAVEWKFTELGAKACGGPVGYIAYSTQIDTEDFLEKVHHYTELQNQFNKDWKIASDCSIPAAPIGVICNDDKEPEFVYENTMVPNE